MTLRDAIKLGFSSGLIAGVMLYFVHPDYKVKTVTSVGGCNQFARCGVRYSDGTGGTELFPYVGMEAE